MRLERDRKAIAALTAGAAGVLVVWLVEYLTGAAWLAGDVLPVMLSGAAVLSTETRVAGRDALRMARALDVMLTEAVREHVAAGGGVPGAVDHALGSVRHRLREAINPPRDPPGTVVPFVRPGGSA